MKALDDPEWKGLVLIYEVGEGEGWSQSGA